MNKVYLAGPINGCTDDEAINWRDVVKDEVGPEYCIDPMRRDYRGREDECVAEIVERDKSDIDASELVIANCWLQSAGTSMEILYAWMTNVPVLAVAPPAGVSPWVRYHAVVFRDLDEAIRHARKLLGLDTVLT